MIELIFQYFSIFFLINPSKNHPFFRNSEFLIAGVHPTLLLSAAPGPTERRILVGLHVMDLTVHEEIQHQGGGTGTVTRLHGDKITASVLKWDDLRDISSHESMNIHIIWDYLGYSLGYSCG